MPKCGMIWLISTMRFYNWVIRTVMIWLLSTMRFYNWVIRTVMIWLISTMSLQVSPIASSPKPFCKPGRVRDPTKTDDLRPYVVEGPKTLNPQALYTKP